MRILYFTRDYTSHDHRFLSALADSGYQAYYLQLERRGHTLEDRPLPAGVEQVGWAGGRAPVSFKDSPRLLLSLRRVLRSIQPQLVLAGPIQRTALLTALAGLGTALVSMSWGYDLIQDANRDALWRWATRFTLRRSAALVGDSQIIRRLAVSHGMPDERIVTFPWGVDIQHFTPALQPEAGETAAADPGGKESSFTLLSTRGWEPVYGVDLIAQAFLQVAQAQPRFRLIMLGNGSQAAMLRQAFQKGGVQDQVLYPGQVRQADLPRYYRMADLYISASHSDGASISLLEAMACGKPVLVSDIPGNREWVEPGESGWWFPDGDAGALAAAIQRAFELRATLPLMGRAARRTAEQRADWQANFPQLFQAFEIALR